MAYCSVSDVKLEQRLNLSVDTHNTAITDCIAQADAWIDARLQPFNSSPDSTTLKHVSADYAAFLYLDGMIVKKTGDEQNRAWTFRKRAEDLLERWIEGYFKTSTRRAFVKKVNE